MWVIQVNLSECCAITVKSLHWEMKGLDYHGSRVSFSTI